MCIGNLVGRLLGSGRRGRTDPPGPAGPPASLGTESAAPEPTIEAAEPPRSPPPTPNAPNALTIGRRQVLEEGTGSRSSTRNRNIQRLRATLSIPGLTG